MKRSVLFFVSIILVITIIAVGGCTKKPTTTTTTAQTSTPAQTSTSTQTSTSVPTSSSTVPAVSLTIPHNGEADIPVNDEIIAAFTEEMDATTINNNTFTLYQGSSKVACDVSFIGELAVLNPVADLTKQTLYSVKISKNVKDFTGIGMTADFEWSFTTGTVDTVSPTVVGTNPSDFNSNVAGQEFFGITDVPINNDIVAFFSEVLDPKTVNNNTFLLLQGTTKVSGTVTYDGEHTVDFNPDSDLIPNTVYTAKITTGITCLASIHLQSEYDWSFTTGAAQTTVPKVISTNPTAGSLTLAINESISATFSEAMDPLTITAASFTLWDGTIPVIGIVDYDGITSTAVFTPMQDLLVGETYTAKIDASVHDLAGIQMGTQYSWSFTAAATDTAVPKVVSTSPTDGATAVPVNIEINITFSELMDPTSVTFVLMQGTTSVAGSLRWDDLTKLTFKPLDPLTSNTVYQVSMFGATDFAGFGTASVVWSFTTAP